MAVGIVINEPAWVELQGNSKNLNSQACVLYNSPVSCRYRRFLPLLLWSAVAMAQTAGKTPLSYKLLSIHVKGLQHFAERDVVSASGLRLGQFAGEEEFKKAAQK